MLPLILTREPAVGLAGSGPALERRRALLAEAGMAPRALAPDGDPHGLALLFIAGLANPEALTARARAAGVLVNVEDMPALCDFHVPAILRRGDLLLTVSTAGKAPGLARLIREWLEARFGGEWAARLGEAEAARQGWRKAGQGMAEIANNLRALVREKGWLS